MYNVKNIGRVIASCRKSLGMTQDELAARLCISAQAVSKWENGVGYPDISLIPAISGILKISPDELFGASADVDADELPSEYKALTFITSDGNAAVYSDKNASEICSDGTVVFSDGSTANLRTMTAINRGAGEIRIYNVSDVICIPSAKKGMSGKQNGTFDNIKSISLLLAHNCDVTISESSDGKTSFEAAGTDTFLSLFTAEAVGETLEVRVRSLNHGNDDESENRIILRTGFSVGNQLNVALTGSSVVKCDVDFNSASLCITGSGDITAPCFNSCNAVITGAGEITLSEVSEKLTAGITGSGAFSCSRANNPQLRLTGSGAIEVKYMSGNASAVLTGSGEITLGGNVHTLNSNVNGSGEVCASRLTVESAIITAYGSCDVTVGRVINESEEKMSKSSTLKVIRRG